MNIASNPEQPPIKETPNQEEQTDQHSNLNNNTGPFREETKYNLAATSQSSKMPNINSSNTNHKSVWTSSVQTSSNFSNTYSQKNKFLTLDDWKQELYYSKNNLNKTNQDYRELRIAYLKMWEDNKINKKIIESILNIQPDEEITQRELNDRIEIAKVNASEEDRLELKKRHKIIVLSETVKDQKAIIASLSSQIEHWISQTKTTRLLELEGWVNQKDNELRWLGYKLEDMQLQIEEYKTKNADLQVKADYNKAVSEKNKQKSKDLQAQNDEYQRENDEYRKTIKSLEERVKKRDTQIKKLTSEIKEKEGRIKVYDNQKEQFEDFTAQKEKIEKQQSQFKTKNKALASENEKWKRRVEALEKDNCDSLQKIEKYEKDRDKNSKQSKDVNGVIKDQENMIQNWKEEIRGLKEKHDKKNKEITDTNKNSDDMSNALKEENEKMKLWIQENTAEIERWNAEWTEQNMINKELINEREKKENEYQKQEGLWETWEDKWKEMNNEDN